MNNRGIPRFVHRIAAVLGGGLLGLSMVSGAFIGAPTAVAADDAAGVAAKSGVVHVYVPYRSTQWYCYDNEAFYPLDKPRTMSSLGSAFGVGKAGEPTTTFVTNEHVISKFQFETANASDCKEASFVYERSGPVRILTSDWTYDPNVGIDTSNLIATEVKYEAEGEAADLAVLVADRAPEGRVALPLLQSDYKLEQGDDVIALGYPGTSEFANNAETQKYFGSIENVTLTKGSVTLLRDVAVDGANIGSIQHTADINHGNSGGPLVLPTGEVAGVNTWGFGDASTGDKGTNNSIEVRYVADVLDDLGIQYDVREPSSGLPVMWIAIIGGVVVLVIIVAVVLLLMRKKRKGAGDAVAVDPTQPASPAGFPPAPEQQ